MLPALSPLLRTLVIAGHNYHCGIAGCDVRYDPSYFTFEDRLPLMRKLEVHHVFGRRTKLDGVPDNRLHMLLPLCGLHHRVIHGQASDPRGTPAVLLRAEAIDVAEQWRGKEDRYYLDALVEFRSWYLGKKLAAKKVRQAAYRWQKALKQSRNLSSPPTSHAHPPQEAGRTDPTDTTGAADTAA